MEKRLTVDLNEEIYKELIRLQLESVLNGEKKKSLSDLLKEAVIFWIDSKKEKAATK